MKKKEQSFVNCFCKKWFEELMEIDYGPEKIEYIYGIHQYGKKIIVLKKWWSSLLKKIFDLNRNWFLQLTPFLAP